jgi:hypothetical protein
MSDKPPKTSLQLDGNENSCVYICAENRATIQKFSLVLAVTSFIYARGKFKKQDKLQHMNGERTC